LKLGNNTEDDHAVEWPKDLYSLGGVLEIMPIVGVHLPGVQTKLSRHLAFSLIQSSKESSSEAQSDAK